MFLDADDWLAPDALQNLAATLQASPEAVAAVGRYARVDDAARCHRDPRSGAAIPRNFSLRRIAPPRDLLPRLLVQNPFANGGHVLIRRDAAQRAGPFRPSIAYGEDWEYFIRLALQGLFVFVPIRTPLLFVRSRAEGAYRRLAADPAAFAPCMQTIFANPVLIDRFGQVRLATLRRQAEAENAWIVGRELIRHGHAAVGRHWLRRSVAAAPGPKRAALLAAAHLLPLLPDTWRGPFRPYAGSLPSL